MSAHTIVRTFGLGIAAVHETVGPVAADALRVCLYDRGWIDVSITDLHQNPPNYTLFVSRRGNLVLPVDVLWIHKDGSHTTTSWDAVKPMDSIHFNAASPVINAVLDPEHKILLDEDLANNAIHTGTRPHAGRTRSELMHVGALILQAVTP